MVWEWQGRPHAPSPIGSWPSGVCPAQASLSRISAPANLPKEVYLRPLWPVAIGKDQPQVRSPVLCVRSRARQLWVQKALEGALELQSGPCPRSGLWDEKLLRPTLRQLLTPWEGRVMSNSRSPGQLYPSTGPLGPELPPAPVSAPSVKIRKPTPGPWSILSGHLC